MRGLNIHLLIIIFLSILPVSAQPQINEVVVVTADQEPVEFENNSRTVTVLNRVQIDQIPASSVTDLLRYVSSVEVKARGPFGVQGDISVRGSGFGRILIMVNGVRMNDSQTGHHNADLPVSLSDIERIEVLHGASSSIHGADAFGGTINIITREADKSAEVRLSGGQHGLVDGSASVGFKTKNIRQSLGFWGNRSSGFMYDRDFRTLGFRSRTSIGSRSAIEISHVDKDIGANGFYGPSPSREWTNSTLASFKHQFGDPGTFAPSMQAFYRTHGDKFLWDIRRPGLFENRHRTHAAGTKLAASKILTEKTSLVYGTEVGGDWIRSSNLGDHQLFRSGLFAQMQYAADNSFSLVAGTRWEYTSMFGNSLNPSISSGWWIHPALRFRASAGHAFRIPTFTELYYFDPRHQASPDLDPEKSWDTEVGIDWYPASSWLFRGNLFYRWEDDVIDWVRDSAELKWETINIREVQAGGIEVSLAKSLGTGAMLQIQYSYLALTTDEFPVLSKYVFDYPRHSLTGFSSFALPLAVNFSQKVDYKKREDGRDYWLVDMRLARDFDKTTVFVEGSNLLNTRYQELLGVDMPGRWIRAGFNWKIY